MPDDSKSDTTVEMRNARGREHVLKSIEDEARSELWGADLAQGESFFGGCETVDEPFPADSIATMSTHLAEAVSALENAATTLAYVCARARVGARQGVEPIPRPIADFRLLEELEERGAQVAIACILASELQHTFEVYEEDREDPRLIRRRELFKKEVTK